MQQRKLSKTNCQCENSKINRCLFLKLLLGIKLVHGWMLFKEYMLVGLKDLPPYDANDMSATAIKLKPHSEKRREA